MLRYAAQAYQNDAYSYQMSLVATYKAKLHLLLVRSYKDQRQGILLSMTLWEASLF